MKKKIFISYSHRDEAWKNRLVSKLNVLALEGVCDVWDDRKIESGSDWKLEIKKALDEAHIAILIISNNFLTSNFILSEEVPKIFERRRTEGLWVIPVFARPCAWNNVPWLSGIQGEPRNGKTLQQCAKKGQAEKILSDLAEKIEKRIATLELSHRKELLTEQVPSGGFISPNKFRKDIPPGLSHSSLKVSESKHENRFPKIANFGAQLKKWSAIIIALVLLSFPIWKSPVVSLISKIGSIISPIDQEQVNYVKRKFLLMEIIYQKIENLKQYKGDDIQKEIQLLKSLILKAQSLIAKEAYREAYELLSGKIEGTLSILNEQFSPLSYESKKRCELSILKFKAKKDEIKKACEDAKLNYNRQPRSSGLDAINYEPAHIFEIELNPEVMIKAEALHMQALNADKEKQYLLAVALLDETTTKYNDICSWVDNARIFITTLMNYNLQDALCTYRKNYPFVNDPDFYKKFRKLEETACKTLNDDNAGTANKQFNELKTHLEEAKELANRYKKDHNLLNELKEIIPQNFENGLRKITNQLNSTTDEIAQHDFEKATKTFKTVEENRLKLINESMDSELGPMKTKLDNDEIYSVYVSLDNFKKKWNSYLESSIENKKLLKNLEDKLEKPIIPLGDGVNLEMIYIQGGTFQMGSPISEPEREENEYLHTVKLDGFWIGKYEITQKQYEKIMNNNPSPSLLKNSQNPVVNVNWESAKEFCKRLQKTGNNFRLPTEAEWEYACRGGTNTPYYWDKKPETSAPVTGSLVSVEKSSENPKGLFGMCGNVWEWCEDWYGEYDKKTSIQVNPKGPPSGKGGVLRGGSFKDKISCRSAYRRYGPPECSSDSIGFRVVISM